ncbi:MAG: radical SAM protein [Acidobacteria bacterium]|nr:MAG: radical SAM protein [Acidobacteriota bacterium]
MKVLLISANTEVINMPVIPSGVLLVASAAKAAGHQVEMLDLRTEAEPLAAVSGAIKSAGPEVIGVSVRNIDDQNMRNPRFLLPAVKDLIAECRRLSEAPVVLGGAGYSIFPRSALAFLGGDLGIQGDGETAFPAVLGRLERREDLSSLPGVFLPGVSAPTARSFPVTGELNALPETDLLPQGSSQSDLWMPLQTRRGCPYRCSYCSTPAIEGTRVRVRPQEGVVRAIEQYVAAGFRRFYFTDNTFNLPEGYALGLCRLLGERRLGISWRSILYPGRISEDLIRAMAEAGCAEVSLGFESGNQGVLRALGKHFSPADVRFTSRLLAEHGIHRTGFLLLGGPGETINSAEESLAFADSLGLEAVKVSLGLRIYPGTRLGRTAVREGLIDEADDLLLPRFYMSPNLERLPDILGTWLATRPHWMA